MVVTNAMPQMPIIMMRARRFVICFNGHQMAMNLQERIFQQLLLRRPLYAQRPSNAIAMPFPLKSAPRQG